VSLGGGKKGLVGCLVEAGGGKWAKGVVGKGVEGGTVGGGGGRERARGEGEGGGGQGGWGGVGDRTLGGNDSMPGV